MLKNFSKLRFDILTNKAQSLLKYPYWAINFSTKILSKEQRQEILDMENSNEKFSQKYFEAYVKLIPNNDIGIQKLSKKVFYKALNDASTSQDIEYSVTIIAEYMGHCNPVSSNNIDEIVNKAIKLECPNKLAPLFKNHRALQYYPQPSLLESIVELYYNKNDYKTLKEVFTSFLKRDYLKKSSKMYDQAIEILYKNKDYEFAIEVFLDVLDYDTTILNAKTFNIVLCSNDKFFKDKMLKELIESVMEKHKLTNTGSLILFALFELNAGDRTKYDEYISKIQKNIEEIKLKHQPQIFESEHIKKYIEQLITDKKEEKILKILKEDLIRQEIFDESYKDTLAKLD